MLTFRGKNGNELYLKELDKIEKCGKKISPRGLKTKELYGVTTEIKYPRQRFQSVLGRDSNPFFLCAEAMWILAGKQDAELLLWFNSQMGKFLDVGFSNFYASYGARMRWYGMNQVGESLRKNNAFNDQLRAVVTKLKNDKDTRQAVMTFFDPFQDNIPGKLDYPCNCLSMFKIRDNKLHLHQVVRSNDINLGLFPTNAFQFSIIQSVVAHLLEARVGELWFFSDSLHSYEDFEQKGKILKYFRSDIKFDMYDYVIATDNWCFDSIEQMDRHLKNFWKYIFLLKGEKLNTNNIGGSMGGTLYHCLNMCLSYLLWKQDKRVEALKLLTHKLPDDFLISALKFYYKLNDRKVRKIIHYKLRERFLTPVIKYVKGEL